MVFLKNNNKAKKKEKNRREMYVKRHKATKKTLRLSAVSIERLAKNIFSFFDFFKYFY